MGADHARKAVRRHGATMEQATEVALEALVCGRSKAPEGATRKVAGSISPRCATCLGDTECENRIGEVGGTSGMKGTGPPPFLCVYVRRCASLPTRNK